ncbi:MAG TPA: methionine--tRNA ligase [Polyangiaceae bacterium]|nr:methionine--tRNA ligase [Polyangiaceae bacterium]
MTDTIFITTSIPYVNGAPHVGFAWELVLADVLARYHRARGRRVRFLTGTDDNSLKNVRAAEAEGADTAAFVRARSDRFVQLGRALGLSNDDFIRTAFDPRHAPAVERLWRACDAAGDVYRSSYRGAYCVGCERFFAPHELAEGGCPEHDTPLERIDEENYFFRLGRHQGEIDRLLQSGELRIWPDVYRGEAYGWVEAGLADFSISRSTARARGWGVGVPDEPGQIVYVWFDALANYISALGYAGGAPALDEFWDHGARRIHVIGKNVTRFHCIYWPAILASAGLRAPSDVVVHGFLTVDGRKIGKSLGNGVDPFELVERFGADRLRHYLLRHFPLGRDGDFSTAGLVHAANDELADQLGNLLQRVLVLLEQNTGGVVPATASEDSLLGGSLAEAARRAAAGARTELERCDPQSALAEVFAFVRACNLQLSRTEPWKLARRARESRDPVERAALDAACQGVLADAARGLLWAAALLEPFLPDAAARIAAAFGAAAPGAAPAPAPTLPEVYADVPPEWSRLGRGAQIRRPDVLFSRLASD